MLHTHTLEHCLDTGMRAHTFLLKKTYQQISASTLVLPCVTPPPPPPQDSKHCRIKKTYGRTLGAIWVLVISSSTRFQYWKIRLTHHNLYGSQKLPAYKPVPLQLLETPILQVSLAEMCSYIMVLNSNMIVLTPLLDYLKIRPLPNSTLSPISLSQWVTARNLTDTNLGEMYDRNCNLSPLMFAISSVSVQSEQYKLILTWKKCCF